MEEAATRALALEAHMEAAQARAAELQQSQVGRCRSWHEVEYESHRSISESGRVPSARLWYVSGLAQAWSVLANRVQLSVKIEANTVDVGAVLGYHLEHALAHVE